MTSSPAPSGTAAPQDDAGTEPSDYLALNAVYGALLASVIVATRNHGARDEPIGGLELLPIGAATFALSKVIAREKMGTWVRDPFVVGEGTYDRTPRGRGLRHVVGELVTCSRCVGAWSGLGIVGLRLASPPAGRALTSVLAASAANDFLHAGFRLLCARSNAEAGG